MDKTRTKLLGWPASVLMLAGASVTHGAILNGVTSDSGVQQFNQTNSVDTVVDGDGFLGIVNEQTMRVGQTTGNAGVTGGPNVHAGANAVFVFQLPTLGAGEQFASASLTFTITGVAATGNKSFIVDLYGLGARAGNAVTTNDYYEGTGDTTDATLLQQAIISASNGTGGANGTNVFPVTVTTSLLGSDNLADYLNSQYSSAGAGAFIFLRLNTQQPSQESASGGYQIASANHGTVSIRPFITYTIPEPASLALLGAGCLCLVRRRSRVDGD